MIAKSLKDKVQFWAVLGPFVIIQTMFVSIVRVSPENFYLPLAALIGIPICLRWKLRGGLAMAILVVVMFLATHSAGSSDDRFWQFGMVIALVLGFVVTALSFEEVDSMIKFIHLESKSRLDNLMRVDEKLREAQEQQHLDCEEFGGKIKALVKGSEGYERRIEVYEKTEETLREEIEDFYQHKEKLLEEIFKVRRSHANISADYDDAMVKVEELQQFRTSTRDDRENGLLDALETTKKELHDRDAEISRLCIIDEDKDRELLKEKQCRCQGEEQIEKLKTVLSDTIKEALSKKEFSVPANGFEGMYNQLQEQFRDKSVVLDKTRADLFLYHEKVEVLERDKFSEDFEPREIEVLLQNELVRAEEEIQHWNEEANSLNDIITRIYTQ